MKLKATLALSLCLTASAAVQAQNTFTDPANLRGEHVRPHDGRELPVDQGASGLQQLLRKLNTRASILNIVAHPDDEDGGMLAFYSRGLGARVADLSLTRGEGGQNAMTGDFEDALGLLRTQELLASDRYPGIDQFFGTEVDFGFSKTKEEAFGKWTHDRVLYDAVRAIRLYRPLVITATFIGGVTDGHGQHQVSGQIAQEAFKAAADPKVFPEMIAEGILPWQALRVYARVPMQSITPQGLFDYATGQYTPARFTNYVTGEVTTTQPSVDVVVHEGKTDPLLTRSGANPADLGSVDGDPTTPLSYVQFARIGLGLQRSQVGPGVRSARAGAFDVSYHRYGMQAIDQNTQNDRMFSGSGTFFDGIDTSLTGIATLAPHAPSSLRFSLALMQQEIDMAERQSHTHAGDCAPTLADALHSLDALIASVDKLAIPAEERANTLHELRIKRVQMNDALVLALGVSLSTHLATNLPGECSTAIFPSCIARVETNFTNGPTASIRVASDFSSYNGQSKDERTFAPSTATLAPGERLNPTFSFFEESSGHRDSLLMAGETDPKAPALMMRAEGRPYFSRRNIEQPVYDIAESDLRLAPETPRQVFWTRFSYAGADLLTGRVLTTSTGPGDPGVPLVFVPSLSVAVVPTATVALRTLSSVPVTVQVRSTTASANKGLSSGTVRLKVPPEWAISETNPELSFKQPGETVTVPFTVKPSILDKPSYTLSVAVEGMGGKQAEGYRTVGYPGLVPTNLYTPATLRVVPVDLLLPAHQRIAYLPGTGDDVPSALAAIGLGPKILTIADLTATNLAQYDTVILGVRTYNAHADLHGAPTQALLDYARNGGNVVVQYQTTEFTGADAPYPLSLGSNEKVVDETAPVQLLDAANPLLSTPNRITPADFNSWVEERGHGFLSTWDQHYTALTETHDPGGPETQPQAPQRGGLITTPLGKGRWTYCAFALYRQLPEAVPGAYRLFVNLLNP